MSPKIVGQMLNALYVLGHTNLKIVIKKTLRNAATVVRITQQAKGCAVFLKAKQIKEYSFNKKNHICRGK